MNSFLKKILHIWQHLPLHSDKSISSRAEINSSYPKEKCIHQLFEEQVERSPELTALVFKNESLSYRELNLRANQLAYHLKLLGVGPDSLVGLCMERSLEMIVALLGILKAGGAYIPLDSNLPPSRLAFLLNDIKAPLVLVDPRCRDRLSALLKDLTPQPRIFSLGDFSQAPEINDRSNLPCTNTSKDLAYVMYTSGTSGPPKGVMIPHLGVVRLVVNPNYVEITPQDVFLQAAPLSFDASTFEIWGCLLNGAKLVLASTESVDYDQLGRVIIESGITTLWLTASVFHQMMEYAPEALQGVRQLLAGGDVLSPSKVRAYLNLPEHGRLINGYGPTENTTFTCCCSFDSSDQIGDFVSIGSPISGTDVYILDTNLQPVAIGEIGEIYAGGDGLARGYLNAPELTANRFILDPFSAETEARMYRTGDLGRLRADGNIEFLGRLDHQVKIRGHRIELSEIELVLKHASGIEECVVIASESKLREKHLRAYLVASKRFNPPSSSELREFLIKTLPVYMVPSAFVILDKIPLTPNGKVDRKALEGLEGNELLVSTSYEAPRNELERTIADIWQKLLGREQIGVNDNFFDLGGHSLLAAQLLARMRKILNLDFSIRLLFEYPSIASIAGELAHFDSADNMCQLMPIPVRQRNTQLPLSFDQQRFWFFHQYVGASSAYHIQVATQFWGNLNQEALAKAIDAVILRHEILRTHFVEIHGELTQVVSPVLKVPLEEENLSALDTDTYEEALFALLRREFLKPFVLSQGPLMRAKLFKLSEREYVLALTFDHIIFDGWSVGILCEEIKELYKEFSAGKKSLLEPLSLQYSDYALWQRGRLQGNELERLLSYWRTQLADAPTLELLTDHPRPATSRYLGSHHSFRLSSIMSRSLKDFNRAENVTPFMSLLAAFQLLLGRYSGQTDILVGSPIANRDRVELEGLIGLFVNTVVLRGDLSGNPSFRTMVLRVRDTALDAYAHQELPFEKLVEELNPERSASRHPIFQALFAVRNMPTHPLSLEGMTSVSLELPKELTHFDLDLTLWEEGDSWAGNFCYPTDLFDASTIQRMEIHFQTLLEALLAEPDRPVAELPILGITEQRQILIEWNNTDRVFPRGVCVQQLFEQQVERTPDSVAVVFEKESLSYRELNTRANQLANYLRLYGVGPDILVGLCLERSVEMIIAVLGILKAGGAYVPLDPLFPEERIQFMLEDASPKVFLTETKLAASILVPSATQVVCIDQCREQIRKELGDNLCPNVSSENLVNVIYTSGSTGSPKGALISHQSLVNFLCSMQHCPGISAKDVMLAVTTISFDIAALELFLPLVAGARVVIATREDAIDGQKLAHLIDSSGATLMQATPATWQLLIESQWEGKRLLRVICGGDLLTDTLALGLLERTSELWNLYGPTETTIWSTIFKVQTSSDFKTSVPIGRPIDNTSVYLLDSVGQPVPIGIPGEIYIGGQGVARGYLNRVELTNERFIVDPFSSQPGARLYRTGDLARWMADGNIEFIGRLDYQVKIRGYRVELGEIEAALRRAKGVRDCLVVASGDRPSEKKLIAYLVVADPQAPPSLLGLRRFLKKSLPDYMVPSTFSILRQLPLTPNGKVNRKAAGVGLNGIELNGVELVLKTRVTPLRNEIERSFLKIWQELFNNKQIGVDENFFDLGGHSLLGVQMLSRIRAVLGIDLTLRSLFENPTIAGLVEKYEKSSEGKTTPVAFPNENDSKPNFFTEQQHDRVGDIQDEHLEYWTHKLALATPLLILPTDYARTKVLDSVGKTRTLCLSSELTTSLTTLCRSEGATMFMVLLAAFKLLLSRLADQEDIVIGTRGQELNGTASNSLIGLNTIALRTDLSGNIPFAELLKRVRCTTLEALEHQGLGFKAIAEKLHLWQDQEDFSLFQIFFNMMSGRNSRLALADLEAEQLNLLLDEIKIDLALYTTEQDDKVKFYAVYDAALFHEKTIERLLQQLQYLLTQIVKNPQQVILTYSLQTEQEKLLLPNPRLAIAEPFSAPVTHQFLNIAQSNAAETAIRHNRQDWTYQQLKDASEQIATLLVLSKIEPGDVIAISGRPCFGLIASILGALRARGVILLIDPSLPSLRKDLMLKEAVGQYWIHVGENSEGEENWSERFRTLPSISISPSGVCLTPFDNGDAREVILLNSKPKDPAYIFFTSGTAGKPKAILGSHSGLSHFIDWQRQTLRVLQSDNIAQLTSLSFDVVLREIFLPLTSGATLCLPEENLLSRPDRLVSWMKKERISIVHVVPSFAESWLDSLNSKMDLPALRWVMFAGEPLHEQLVLQWRKQFGDLGEIINLYGPTETTLAKCYYVVPKSPLFGIQPIGQPLPQTEILVLNREGQLCGIGELGEISIRTPFRTLGYLNASDDDRARFSINPFRNDPRDLIYRTGDRGVYADDGDLRILGRTDDQIKIRGARVEPSEISAVLANHGGIRRSIVIAQKHLATTSELVAYIVPSELRSTLDSREVINFLKSRLPDYMIPSRFVMIDNLPLTPNGKVDRKALKELDGEELNSGVIYVAPRDDVERILVTIWQELLTRQQVGINDNFFELGGHSLMAVQVVSRMRERTEVDLPIQMIFESPTPALLAARLKVAEQSADSNLASGTKRLVIRETPDIVKRTSVSVKSRILSKQLEYVRTWKGSRISLDSFIVTLNESGYRQGLFWCLQGYRELEQLAAHMGPEQPMHCMRSGHLIMDYSEDELEAISTCYAAEIIAVQAYGPILLGGNCQGGRIAHAVAQRLHDLGRTVSLLFLVEQRLFPPYAGSVALIFGRDSEFNPYKQGIDPEPIFNNSYPAGFTVDIIPGAHGEFFESPNIEHLARILTKRLILGVPAPVRKIGSQGFGEKVFLPKPRSEEMDL